MEKFVKMMWESTLLMLVVSYLLLKTRKLFSRKKTDLSKDEDIKGYSKKGSLTLYSGTVTRKDSEPKNKKTFTKGPDPNFL
jgi:hypothetical protein